MRAIAALALLTAASAVAAPEGATAGPGVTELAQARTVGLAGANRVMGVSSDAVDVNAATMTNYKRYLIELSGGWDPRNPFGFGSIGLMDSGSGALAGGFRYTLASLGSGTEHHLAHINTLAAALPFGDVLSLGSAVRYVIESGGEHLNAVTADAGLVLHLGGFTGAISGNNLIDISSPEFRRTLGFGVAYGGTDVSVEGDAKSDLQGPHRAWAFSVGAEAILDPGIPLRIGYTYDDIRHQRFLGAGVGAMMEEGSIELGYRHELGGAFSRLLVLTLSMQMR